MSERDEESGNGTVAAVIGGLAGAGGAGAYVYDHEANHLMGEARRGSVVAPEELRTKVGTEIHPDTVLGKQHRAIEELSHPDVKIENITVVKPAETPTKMEALAAETPAPAPAAGEPPPVKAEAAPAAKSASGYKVRVEGTSGKPGNVVGHVELHGVKEVPASAIEALKTEASHTLPADEAAKVAAKGAWIENIAKKADKQLNRDLRGKIGNMWKYMDGKAKGKVGGAAVAGAVVTGLAVKGLLSSGSRSADTGRST